MKTLKSNHQFEETIKKSRFIARAGRVDTVDAAMDFIAASGDPEATHNCWAYKIGDQYRFSDDGEPGGTAGRPMFMAIEQQEFDHTVVVVTRYYGGIKLGAGGLARAYGGAAGKCLQQAEPYIVQHRTVFTLTVPFSGTGIVYQFLEKYPVLDRLDEQYTETGLIFTLRIVQSAFPTFQDAAMNVSSGTFIIHITEVVWE